MKKIRYGIIGAGGIADRRMIPGMIKSEHSEIVAAMAPHPDIVKNTCEVFHIPKGYVTEEALLADPEVDAVYIASPLVFHADQICKAAEAGKHVFSEKPMALNSNECQKILSVCEKANVKLFVGFNMRFHNLHQKMRDILIKGGIGQIVSCRAQLTCWYPEMENVWRLNKKLSGGGAFMDMGLHCMDLLEYLSNSEIQQVYALTDTMTFSYEVEDCANVMVKFSNKSAGYIDVYFNVPEHVATCCLEFYGTKGSLIAEHTIGQNETGTLYYRKIQKDLSYSAQQELALIEPAVYASEHGDLYAKEIESFSRSILNEEPLITPGKQGLHMAYAAEAVYQSAALGKVISIPKD